MLLSEPTSRVSVMKMLVSGELRPKKGGSRRRPVFPGEEIVRVLPWALAVIV
jgi:hypothetical protein